MRPFISTADLGALLGQDVTTDELAVIAIDAACQSVRTYVDRPLNLIAETVRLDGSGTDTLLLMGPLVNVDTVSEDSVPVDESAYVLGSHAIYRLDGIWAVGRRNIEVEYSHGYAVTEADVGSDPGDVGNIVRMPSDIREVALELAATIFNANSTAGASGALTGETIGDYSYTVDAAAAAAASSTVGVLNDSQRSRLRPYRYIPVA